MDEPQPPGAVRGFASLQLAHEVALEGRVVAVSLIGVLLMAVSLSLAGRVGQDGLSCRVLLWTTCAAVCWPLCHALGAAILYLARSLRPFLIALAATFGTFFFTLLCTAVAYTVYRLFYPVSGGQVPILAVYVDVTLVTVTASAMVHSLVCQIALLRHAWPMPEARPRQPAPDPVAATSAPAAGPSSWFFERLPPELGRDIVWVRASGHYLDVVTTEGTCRVLLPLADAVKALHDLGQQVHRSHWVAHRHVLGIERRGHRTLLRVTGEREIPVSRRRVLDIRRAIRRHAS